MTSRGVPSAITRPASSSTTRSHMLSIAVASCDTKIRVPPWRRNSCIRPWHFSWKASSPTAKTSSSSMISARTWLATENASRICMPLE